MYSMVSLEINLPLRGKIYQLELKTTILCTILFIKLCFSILYAGFSLFVFISFNTYANTCFTVP